MSFCYDLMIVFLIISLQPVERRTLMRARFNAKDAHCYAERDDESITKSLYLSTILVM